MRIINGLIYRPDGNFHTGTLDINDGIFSGVPNLLPQNKFDDDDLIDADGLFVIPGLTDIHFHGCMNYDLCDGDYNSLQAIADYQASVGVTTICPATMTLPVERIKKILINAKNFKDKSNTGAELAGVNLEGPFISPEKIGAQNPDYIIKPDLSIFTDFYEASGGLIKLVDIAPEVDGAMSFIKGVKDKFDNVTVSLAHTTADYDIALMAFDAGISHVTHLYNAMNPINHRNPGPIAAAADFNDENNKNINAEIICDGVHIHPAIVRNTFRMFSDDNIIFISDSMRAAGMPDGDYELGGLPVIKTGNKAILNNGTIAGSVTNLMDCMRTAVKRMGVKLETAIKCAAVNPAKAINIYDRYGSIEPCKTANLVLLNKNLDIINIINRGRRVL